MADVIISGGSAVSSIGDQYLPRKLDIQLYRGDWLEFFVQLKDETDAVVDLNGYTPKMQLKTSYAATDNIIIPTTIVEGNTKIRVYISSTQSSLFTASTYIYDLQTTNSAGNVRTHIAGTVSVPQEVTK